jgi:HlyD family secretion protein
MTDTKAPNSTAVSGDSATARSEVPEAVHGADGSTATTNRAQVTATIPPTARLTLRRRWRSALVALVLVAGLAGGAWYYLVHRAQDESHLVLQGNIDVRQVNLGFKVDGRIETLAVDEGDAVRAGQVIATLDKRYFHDDLRSARARRDNAAANLARLEHGSRPEEIAQARAQTADKEATLARARADFERAKQLVGLGGISKEDYDLRQAALGVAEAQVKSARESQRLVEIGPRQEDIDVGRAQLAEQNAIVVQSERRLADSDLVAPNDGTILTRAREKGAIVQAGETIFTLTLASPVWVRTYVNERDLGRIQPNMAAEVRTDSTDKVYHGFIGFISPTAEFTPKTVETRELRTDLVYRLRVIVDNPDGGLRQGMPVTVILDLNGASGQ